MIRKENPIAGKLLAASLSFFVMVGVASACSVCFGDPDDPQSHGMNMAVLTLLGVTGSVIGSIVAVGTSIALRIRRAELAAMSIETGERA